MEVVDDNDVSKETRAFDKFWKIKPMLDKIQKASRENPRSMNVSINKEMILFHCQVNMGQCAVKSKPNPLGLKKICDVYSSRHSCKFAAEIRIQDFNRASLDCNSRRIRRR